ncbi:MAG: FAD-dependent oxidoreductase [Candidatus Altiarchaeales archaeon WOR_SM1_79]|nr:MAG: FAD-dependent oxidoreductase [Candidatus Altiarchaeales archaeon WOR_SM1_79]
MMKQYEAIIIGAGPAGIFAALTLADSGVKPILILEQGNDINSRRRRGGRDILCGWGGAGAFSDGKLTLSSEVGGFLGDFIPKGDLEGLLKEADTIYLRYGAPRKTYGQVSDQTEELYAKAKQVGLEFIQMEIRHVGTENCLPLLKAMRTDLEDKAEIQTLCRVKRIRVEGRRAVGVYLDRGKSINGKVVIAAPGRTGSNWMREEALRLGLSAVPSPIDIGVRVETPAAVLQSITDIAYESKLIYYAETFDDKVRTFCMNPYGEVVTEETNGIITVNGHSYSKKRTENTNFAVLVSSSFTEPFDDPIAYGKYISQLANLLGKGVIIQRLGDLMEGRRSTTERISRCITRPTLGSATPGDLSFVIPYRYLRDIIEMLEALDKIAPGIFSRHTLLYGVEVKFYSHRIKLTGNLESEIDNLFIIGDGAGITRGLLQASASGIWAAKEALRRI